VRFQGGDDLMLTFDAIIKATRQMTAYGEHGFGHQLGGGKVGGDKPSAVTRCISPQDKPDDSTPARYWDDELKVYAYR
jgi:hypothetical protein